LNLIGDVLGWTWFLSLASLGFLNEFLIGSKYGVLTMLKRFLSGVINSRLETVITSTFWADGTFCCHYPYVAGYTAGRVISKEEGNNRLTPSSTQVGCGCFEVVVDSDRFAHNNF